MGAYKFEKGSIRPNEVFDTSTGFPGLLISSTPNPSTSAATKAVLPLTITSFTAVNTVVCESKTGDKGEDMSKMKRPPVVSATRSRLLETLSLTGNAGKGMAAAMVGCAGFEILMVTRLFLKLPANNVLFTRARLAAGTGKVVTKEGVAG